MLVENDDSGGAAPPQTSTRGCPDAGTRVHARLKLQLYHLLDLSMTSTKEARLLKKQTNRKKENRSEKQK